MWRDDTKAKRVFPSSCGDEKFGEIGQTRVETEIPSGMKDRLKWDCKNIFGHPKTNLRME